MVSPSGALTYALAPNANGIANVQFSLHDDGGTLHGGDDTSAMQTLKITVSPVNDPPTCANDSNATFVGTALNALLGSCTDIDGDTLTFAGGLTSPSHGTVTIHPNGTYTVHADRDLPGHRLVLIQGERRHRLTRTKPR